MSTWYGGFHRAPRVQMQNNSDVSSNADKVAVSVVKDSSATEISRRRKQSLVSS